MKEKSYEISKIAINMVLTTREEEKKLKEEYKKNGILTAAVNIGGKMPDMTIKIVENSIVAAIKNGLVEDNRSHNGIIIGAVRDALNQVSSKTNGFNVGGKISLVRIDEDISVAVLLNIGILHLNEVAIATAHRIINK
ncbi:MULTISPECIES: HutP family protein [Psychrilyobacter]|uniref:Hut operon positive regulatory protein n=1 Tax=Psychrilyobacter piezotolerans TaxID=2293438 RepID=A0ABX9KKT0_9FUSO|nr:MULTISPECIES: HutP family protein [Psychrilyobacter]MCS5420565.1 HutP family protein [Psychrilyobacter sp. S5]NDI76639.1 hut operon positive regulator HutP [Psychrilyobacter piezotolerans]RDE65265.1 hut operon positive regulator HutP [Psychrilyobacter sp. S5]REI42883.1 hut operon positive regulator HutP [Psychrilyobacter piezotolerans]